MVAKPRLLLLSYAFPPAALPEAVLSTKRFGSLPEFDVDVVCLDPAGTSIRLDHSLDDYVARRFAAIQRVSPPILLRPLARRRIGAMFELPTLFHLMNRKALQAVLRLKPERYDAIVTWSQWHAIHLVGAALKRRFRNVPLIAHFSDPWVDNPFAPYDGPLRTYLRGLERRVFEAADILSFTSEEAIDLVLAGANGSYRSKAIRLPHAFLPDFYPAGPLRTDGPFMLRSLGNFYGKRSPEPLFAALAILRDSSLESFAQIRVELIGAIPDVFRDRLAAYGLPEATVRVLSPVDYKTSLALMRSADLLLNIDAPFEKSVFLPSKLVDYIGAERPILGITPPGTAARIIADLGGWVAAPKDPGAVADALSAALHTTSRNRGAPWGDPDVRRCYQASTVAAEFKRLLEGRLGLPA